MNVCKRSPIPLTALTLLILLAPLAAGAIDSRPGGYERPELLDPLGGGVPWSDDIDGYATDSQLHGQGGWKGWGNSSAAGALAVDDQARSTPNSIEIVGAADLVREYTAFDSGRWTYTAHQYIPAAFTGESYFILLNTYVDTCTGSPACNWSVQVLFDSATDQLGPDFGACTGTLPIVYDQWVEIRVEIDLDADLQTFFYGGQQLYQCSWSAGASGGGVTSIRAVDLFANGATAVYYDDISLTNEIFSDGFEDETTDAWSSTVP